MADDKTVSTDAADAVKARRGGAPRAPSAKTTRKADASHPQAVLGTAGDEIDADDLNTQDEPTRAWDTLALSTGVTRDEPAPAHTLTGSFVAGHIDSVDYTYAMNDGYYSWYPPGCRQVSTKLLWNRGQRVLRSYYERYGGDSAASSPLDAQPVNTIGGGVAVASNGPGVPGHVVTPAGRGVKRLTVG